MTLELTLAFISFIASSVAGVVGFGGGMLLIAFMPSLLPINAVIPIHGITQLSSNLSRAVLGYEHIQYEVIPKFVVGSFLGIAFFSAILYFTSLERIPFFIGIYILLSMWSDKFNAFLKKFENFYIVGFVQTGLSLVIGASGPISMTILLKTYKNKDEVVVTSAVLMTISHIFKLVVFIFFGFAFFEYIWLIVFMIVGAILGSFVGTKLRNKIDGKRFTLIVKILLSVLAIKLIGIVILESYL